MLRKYSMEQAVERLSLDVVEFRHLVHHFSEFLSPHTEGAAERLFSEDDLELLSRIREMLAREDNDPGSVRLALRKERIRNGNAGRRGCVYAFCSGRPGTGKSSCIHNLGIALSSLGHRVVIFDGSIGGGGLYRMLFAEQEPGWYQELPSGLAVISGEKYLECMEMGLESVAAEMTARLKDYNDSSDFVLVDTGVGRSDNALRYAMAVDEIVIVTTTDVGTNADCFSVIRMLKDIDPDLCVRLVIDRAVSHGSAREVLSRINGAGKKLGLAELQGLGWIAEDDALRRCMEDGEAVFESLPTSMSARCILRLAEQMASAQSGDRCGDHDGLPELVQAMHNAMNRGVPSRGAF